jgi:uncharacterized membrane protein (UPF0127 family)
MCVRLGSLLIVCALLVVMGGGTACGKAAPPTGAATTLSPDTVRSDAGATGTTATGAVPTVVALPDSGGQSSVRVSLARTERETTRGLMFVQNLPPDDGMLFIFKDEIVRTFWMKNTLIPLDMIFIGSDMNVVGVVANAKPLTTSMQTVGKESRFVLEVNGGWASHHGVTAGTKMRFDNISL